MSKSDDMEEHIKKLRSIFDKLNTALLAEGSNPIIELEFIQQLLASLPESWQYLVSVIDQTPVQGDNKGIQLSANITSHLLAEYHCRKAQTGEKAFFASNRPNNRPQQQGNASDQLNKRCNNCNILGHIKRECRKPGGGAYKGGNRSNNNGNNSNRKNNGGNRNFNNNRGQNNNPGGQNNRN